MNRVHIRLIRKNVKALLKAALRAEVAGCYPPAEANLIRLKYRHAMLQYEQMLKTFKLKCEPTSPDTKD